jgi:DNA-binding PadR family transcriptional regulator
VIKLKGGSLYSTIDRLLEDGLIRPVETSREGRRPERTVYAVTELGQDDLMAWLRELLARPVHEYPGFGAVLAFVAALPPEVVSSLLELGRRVHWLFDRFCPRLRLVGNPSVPDLPAIRLTARPDSTWH